MADRVRAFDWAATPLGPIEVWPQSLRGRGAPDPRQSPADVYLVGTRRASASTMTPVLPSWGCVSGTRTSWA